MADRGVTEARRACAVSVLGGPTTLLDIGGHRVVVDPTFDPPGPHAYLTKTAAPAVDAAALGRVDVVLVSHELPSLLAIADDGAFLDADSRTVIATGSPASLRDGCADPAVQAFMHRERPAAERAGARAGDADGG